MAQKAVRVTTQQVEQAKGLIPGSLVKKVRSYILVVEAEGEVSTVKRKELEVQEAQVDIQPQRTVEALLSTQVYDKMGIPVKASV